MRERVTSDRQLLMVSLLKCPSLDCASPMLKEGFTSYVFTHGWTRKYSTHLTDWKTEAHRQLELS